MADHFDVVVVGARVAGCAVATHLARWGLSVCMVDRARFPSDTLSTHIFQDLPRLQRLGVLDRLLATGAPPISEILMQIDDVDLSQKHADLAVLSVRRTLLDEILVDNAIEAGVEVRTHTAVKGVVWDSGRVTGVVANNGSAEVEISGRVIIGADGRNSAVARAVSARRYNVTESERSAVWAYYEGVEASPTIHFCRQGSDAFIACPADSGLFLVIVGPSRIDLPKYRDGGAGFDEAIATYAPIAKLVDGARRVRHPIVVARWQGYLRESAGRGWALVGDAGHFKDPTPGQGISDALRQAEALAAAIAEGLDEGAMDNHLQRWWRWRDADALEKYWWAQDLGRGGEVTPLLKEILRKIGRDPQAVRELHEVFFHLRRPSKVLTPARLLGAARSLLFQQPMYASEVLAEVGSVIALDRQRKRLGRYPDYEARPEKPGPELSEEDKIGSHLVGI